MTDLPPPPPTYGSQVFSPVQTSENFEFASWWRRAGAAVLDMLIVGFLAFVVVFFALASAGGPGAFAVLALIALVCGVVMYDVAMVAANNGQTLGKMVTGIRVVPEYGPHGKVSWGKAWGRWGAEFGLTICFNIVGAAGGIGAVIQLGLVAVLYLSPIWRNNKQTWYDSASGTWVVRA